MPKADDQQFDDAIIAAMDAAERAYDEAAEAVLYNRLDNEQARDAMGWIRRHRAELVRVHFEATGPAQLAELKERLKESDREHGVAGRIPWAGSRTPGEG